MLGKFAQGFLGGRAPSAAVRLADDGDEREPFRLTRGGRVQVGPFGVLVGGGGNGAIDSRPPHYIGAETAGDSEVQSGWSTSAPPWEVDVGGPTVPRIISCGTVFLS